MSAVTIVDLFDDFAVLLTEHSGLTGGIDDNRVYARVSSGEKKSLLLSYGYTNQVRRGVYVCEIKSLTADGTDKLMNSLLKLAEAHGLKLIAGKVNG